MTIPNDKSGFKISSIRVIRFLLVLAVLFSSQSCKQDNEVEDNLLNPNDLQMLGRAMKSFDFKRPVTRNNFDDFFDKELGKKSSNEVLDDTLFNIWF